MLFELTYLKSEAHLSDSLHDLRQREVDQPPLVLGVSLVVLLGKVGHDLSSFVRFLGHLPVVFCESHQL